MQTDPDFVQIYEGDGVNPRWKNLLHGDGHGVGRDFNMDNEEGGGDGRGGDSGLDESLEKLEANDGDCIKTELISGDGNEGFDGNGRGYGFFLGRNPGIQEEGS